MNERNIPLSVLGQEQNQPTSTPKAQTPPDQPIPLEPPEQEILREELTALLAALPPDRRAPYQALADAVGTDPAIKGSDPLSSAPAEIKGSDPFPLGTIPPALVRLLESVLELILGSGRVRHDHRAEGERILLAVYKRTPRGAAADQELAQVNKALSVLSGQTLSQIRVSSRIPGRYTLMVDTETLHLELVADAKGLRIEKAAV